MADPLGCVKEIAKCILWPPVKSHFDYWWCFDDNIQCLRDEVRDLREKRLEMNQKIQDAQRKAEDVRPEVEDWLNTSTNKDAEGRIILQDGNIPKAWNLISRYSMGKSAKQTAEDIAKLRNDGNFMTISVPPPPPAMRSISHRPTMDFKSRERIEENIIEFLKNSSVNMIGICGMGGVGKTTMVQRIGKRVMEEKLFDEVVTVVVSQQIDMLNIQKEIAKKLGLEIDATADKLHTRLMDKNKKIIIFDDVWEGIKLEDLGVPIESGFERCKILLTTRSNYVCKEMDAQKVIEMEVLTEEEAWSLFKEKAGDCVEHSLLLSVAKDVAAECKCLPLALVTVGKALQDEMEKRIWDDSLSQLRESNPTDFSEVLAGVYKPLRLSYDYLDNERERLLFLLCCLFPEDYDMPVEHLTWYIMGLSMFDRISNIEKARNRTHRLVRNLKSRFLLMDGRDKHHVKMHDVVRDVAIFIGSKVEHGFLKSLEVIPMDSPRENSSGNCNWMSAKISNEIIDLPLGLHFPNLRLLMMLKSTSDKVSDISFEGMEDLNVLSFSEIEFPSLPPTVGLLKSLRTLHLYRSNVRNISVVGKLASLEILSCSSCHSVEELPAEIGRLIRLRLLELYECQSLKTIAFGVISSLVRLEELRIFNSFSGWEAEEKGKERRNAALTELESLPNLTCLEIQIDDWNLAAQEICLPQKLVKYCIHIASNLGFCSREKEINLNLWGYINVGKWIHTLVRNTEYLRLVGYDSANLNLAETENLRILRFRNCSTVKKLVNTIDCKFGTVFSLLEALYLYKLEKLEEICDGPNQNVSLCNLASIEIEFCSNLRYLFSVSMAMGLLQLEVLLIGKCDTMEQVFWNENKSITSASIEFPKLKTLRLGDLPNLTAFCQGVESIKFPKLTDMRIGYLPKLNSLCPLNSEPPPHDDTSIHFLCNQKVEIGDLKGLAIYNLKNNISNIWCHQVPINFFPNLETLEIRRVNGIKNLMAFSIAKNFVSLRSLEIYNCIGMVEVIEFDDKEGVDISLFPTLKLLQIENIPKLRSFCQCKDAFELPSLENVEIDSCPRMETFTLGSLQTLNMRRLVVNKKEIDYTKDLNDVIRKGKFSACQEAKDR